MASAISSRTKLNEPNATILWPTKKTRISQPAFEEHTFTSLDDKSARMLEFIINEEFKAPLANNRVHLRLALWVINNKINAHAKRVFDIVFSSLSLLFLSPIFLITAIAIKLDSPGPVFFRQVRVGKRGKHFGCYKFRSMVVGADSKKKELLDQNEADEIVFKMKADPRVTRVGRIIRKLSIDELPQLINVLLNDMSIVGPRPPVPIEVEYYQFDQYYRLDAVPGLTGLQQVEGRSDITFKRWVELDLMYIQEQSFWKDIMIILKTIPVVISTKGAY
jgi:exopolysaccharide biosynthesis polyprenyl glycosylphosphotransferase